MHDIRGEHKIDMHVTLVYHPYKLIYHAEQVPENETSGCRGKHMKISYTNNSDSNIDGNNISFDINIVYLHCGILYVHYMFII